MKFAVVPHRSPKDPFLFAVDHCFPIKGQGTVMTGTVLRGQIKIGDEIEVPEVSLTRRVKSMQKFKLASLSAMQGDRVGICVTQFDPALLERGFACAPGTLTSVQSFIVPVNMIKYFKLPAISKQKFHFTIAHSTVVGSVLFFAPVSATSPQLFGTEHL
jgi:selenocysteine-specific elongation factor